MRWQGFAVGVLSLTLLEVVLRSQSSAQRAGGILTGASKVISKFIDPAVPAFKPVGATSSSTTTPTQPASKPATSPPTSPQAGPLPAGVIAV